MVPTADNRRPADARGFSIIEVMLAAAVFSVFAAAILIMVVGPLQSAGGSNERERAVFLAEEGIEAARSIRNDGWLGLAAGGHGITRTSGTWAFSGASDATVEGGTTYVRTVTVDPVERDGSGNIVASGGTVDPRTRKVTSRVTWTTAFGVPTSTESSVYLTHHNAYQWRQSTDADFNAGTFSDTQVMNTGEAASVELNPTGVKTWTLGAGALITHTTDTDFGPGTFGNTVVSGTGTAADVRGTGSPKWIQIQAGSNVFETDHIDFGDGTFSNTAVADTGDLAGVQMSTAVTWALMASPTSTQLNSVSFASSTFGFAVGNGGAILKWDGTSWTTVASPVGSALNAVKMVSSTFGVAVGANGSIIHWDGTSWTAMTSPTNQVLSGVDCLSATNCWAVGNSGKILNWNGVLWAQFTDTGNDQWASVDMVSATDGWVVGGSVARRFNGATWSVVADGTTATYASVSCSASTWCFAVGSGGTIIRWNGTTWATTPSSTANGLTSVSTLSTSDAWATGAGGTLVRWNGTAWSAVTSPSANPMNEIAMISSNDGYVVGNNGEIWQYASHFLTSGSYVSSVLDGGAVVTWGHAFWAERLPDLTDLTIAFRTGNTSVPDGTWSAFSAEFTDPTNTLIPAGIASARYIQYRATLTTSDQFSTPRLDAINLTFNEPAPVSYFDVKVTAATDGWAVGQGGSLARFDGTQWSVYLPSPTADTLLDVDFAGPNDVWAVGDNGRIIKWNGSGWSVQTSGTTRTLYGVDVLSTTDAWAVGASGTIRRWNGTAWNAVSSPSNQALNAVSMLSGTEGWAVGNNGTILRWNGTAWTQTPSGTTNPLNGVFAVNSTFAVAVGQGGLTLHWNGTSWVNVASTTPNALNDVWCVATNDCWAFGVEATFLQWNGSVWSQYVFANPSNPLVQGGHMTSPTEGWAVGEGGAFYHYTPQFVSPSTYVSPVIDGGAPGIVWNTATWDSVEPIFTNITVATRTGPTPTPDGSWSAFSSEYTDKGGSNVASPANRYIQYRVTFTTTVPQSMGVFQELRLVHSAATGQDLYDTDGTVVGDVWAVGRSGTIVHYNGTSWSTFLAPGAGNLRGIDAVTATDAFIVGDGGILWRWDGSSWSALSSPTVSDLLSVSMLSATDGWAVGAGGVIVRWNGTSWSTVSSPTASNLRGVHCLTAASCVAVGDGGTIIVYDGVSWATASSPTANQLNAVHCISASLCWAVGNGGVIVRWNGTSWAGEASPTAVNINAVESRTAGEAWAVGDFGTILEYDGSSWSTFTSPTTRHLFGITVEAPTDGWAVGRTGTILKDPGSYPATGTFTSSVLDTDAGAATWDAFFFNVTLPAPTGATVAVRSGNVAVPDGTWSAFSAEYALTTGVAIPVPAARYFQYRVTLTTSDGGFTPSFEDITVTYRK